MKVARNLKFTSKYLAIIILFILISFAFSSIVIQDFSYPLTGWVGIGSFGWLNYDYVDLQEYTGYYLAKNLSFNPFPQLDLFNNQSFYPYGTNSVFQPWSLEKDYFYAILYSFFGTGSWLQIYYLLTVLITAIGTFALLLRDYGFARSASVGFIVSFGNFYAINKYPHHLQYAVIHWIVLSLIADFLIVKRIVLKRHLSLRLILVRACLLFLSFGHDLGYMAGFSLMSFTVSLLFIAVLISYRYLKGELKLIQEIQRALKTYKNDFRSYPRTCLVLLILTLVAAYFYFSLAFQIGREAKSFDFTGISFDTFWANPLRLLVPFFPFLNPGMGYQQFFSDIPESVGDSSPGWFLVILGTLGLWQTRRQITIFIPLLIVFFLCLLYHPLLFPTLKIFPWYAFNRVGGRSTFIYPVILGIFALHINFDWLQFRQRQLLVGFLVLVASIELYTAYSYRLDYKPASLDQSFFAYMEYVKKQPGEAVLDLFFCIAGSGARPDICPYYGYNSGVFALRRFHEKKVMGQYFGRLYPGQVKPYLEAGWDKLFFPDNTQSRQSRCFNEAEWSFLTDFFKFNDFAGINLYVERFPEKCLNEFYDRLGNSAKETVIPGAGKVQFIPKSSELRKQINLSLGTKVKLETSTEF